MSRLNPFATGRPNGGSRRILPAPARSGGGRLTERTPVVRPKRRERVKVSSRPEDSHLRALPDPYVNLSIHTAPDVRPFPWQSCQWAKSTVELLSPEVAAGRGVSPGE